jgi:hypothetical protein
MTSRRSRYRFCHAAHLERTVPNLVGILRTISKEIRHQGSFAIQDAGTPRPHVKRSPVVSSKKFESIRLNSPMSTNKLFLADTSGTREQLSSSKTTVNARHFVSSNTESTCQKQPFALVALNLLSKSMPGPLHRNILRTGQPKARHIGQACQGVLSRLDMAFVHLRTLPSRDWQARLTTVSTLILTTTKQAGRSCQGRQGRMLCQFHVASCWLGAPQHHPVSSTSLSRSLGAQLVGM